MVVGFHGFSKGFGVEIVVHGLGLRRTSQVL